MRDETKLIEGLKKNDPAAYAELMEKLGDSLYNVAFRIVKDREKAHEVVQEAFVKMLKAIDRFEGRSALKTWMYRITVNEALMSLRKELPRLDDPIEELMPHYEAQFIKKGIPDWAQDPEKKAAEQEFHDFFNECVASLPETLRTTYVLKDIDHLSEQEICDVLGITKSAVKNRAHRARLTLQQMIGERYGH